MAITSAHALRFRFAAAIALASAASAQVALVEEGDVVAGVGNVTSISNLIVNDAGDWLVEVDTDNANTDADAAVIANGVLSLREGQALAQPLGATIDSFDSLTLNGSGQSGWNFFLDGTSGTSDDSAVYRDLQLLIQEGDVSTATGVSAGTTYRGFFETKINDGGAILLVASLDDPGIPSTTDRALLVLDGGTEELIAIEGDVLPGQVEPVADFRTGPHNFAYNDLGDVMFIADLTGSTATDHAVYLNDTLLAQEGSPAPVAGRNWTVLSSSEVDVSDACEWVLSGTLDGASSSVLLIVKNGAKFRQSGDSLAAIAPFVLTSFGSGPVALANSSDVLWYGDWDDPDTSRDAGLFVNDQLLVQEGVTTIGGVAVQTVAGIQDAYAISPNGRYVIFEAQLVDGTEGAYLIDRGEVAYQEVRNGSGVNPLCLKAATTPQLGGTWSLTVDTGAVAGATLAVVEARNQPQVGQTIALGELLIDLSSTRLFTRTLSASGGVETLNFSVPNLPAIVGRTAYLQVALLGGTNQLCNALDATAGN